MAAQRVTVAAGMPTPALNADTFYEQRDGRTSTEYPIASLPPRRIAIMLPSDAALSTGTELALFWTASIVRRMGRPFAPVLLAAPKDFRAAQSLLAGVGQLSVEEVVTRELVGADPFATVEWRSSTDLPAGSDADTVIWLGAAPLQRPGGRLLTINAHGWIALVSDGPTEGELTLTAPGVDFDAAPTAIIMAACMAAARVFTDAFAPVPRPPTVALGLDAGTACADADTCQQWLARGRAGDVEIPWKEEQGAAPTLSRLAVVSAGGVGGNVCGILKDSYLGIIEAVVIDPDNFDISNLNRAVGVGIAAVDTPKVGPAAQALGARGVNATAVFAAYDQWRTSDSIAHFRDPSTAVVIGVDQVRTRLDVGSDWPALLINGATSGTTLSAGVHAASRGGCIGCWYGQQDANFLTTRTPMACVAGVAPGTTELRPATSYPFVSVAAAALVVSLLIRTAVSADAVAGIVCSLSIRTPEAAQKRVLPPSDRCLLLCSAPCVHAAIGRAVDAAR